MALVAVIHSSGVGHSAALLVRGRLALGAKFSMTNFYDQPM